MAPTSDERREVAERLRENATKHGVVLDYLGSTQVASWWLLLHTIGCNSNEQEAAFRMLADLIDPCPSMADEQMGKLRRRSTALASMTRIASDMSGWAGELADSCERMSRARIADDVKRFADRIRQEARDALN